ncbi:AI-2E family transporter [Promicromonospora iranensis]|uniref:PurR-regulated permease PerM n=1 Tax=Promicromonospora iranensis TaxID=1105144 RepID=A0ABU2CKG4_9MICO|nr:AI-2E family transporter [Promicromonospora iranensis]MDR7381820.1 putative PurR-regulated permease PerM [Promicromonospora iranensis]
MPGGPQRAARAAGPEGATVGLPARPFGYAMLATLGVGAGLAVLGALAAAATVLVYVGLALFLALALEPGIRSLISRGLPRWAAATVLVVGFAMVIALFVVAVLPLAVQQVSVFGTQLVGVLRDLPEQAWYTWVTSNLGALDLNGLLSSLTDLLTDPRQLSVIAGGVLQVGTGLINGVTAVVIVTALTIYIALTLPTIVSAVLRLVPRSRRDLTGSLLNEVLDSVGRYVSGQLVLATTNATFTLLLTVFAGSPAPILLAIIAFVAALIPVVGTVIGSILVVLATLTVSPVGALVVAIFLLVYMQVEAYVLSPRVMSRAVAVPGVLVIVAALAGAALGGVLGALVAVPVAAAGLLVINRVVLPLQETR